MLPPSWWADEMLGRLARYLRIVGLDTTYESGVDEDELLRRVRVEARILLTRDRTLARRAPGSVLLESVRIEDQWRELRTRYPALPVEPKFVRCTVCNGRLTLWPRADQHRPASGVPERLFESGIPLFRCEICLHVYWEGSHTDSVRKRLTSWCGDGSP